jgi:hypothetical protein
LLVLWRPRRDLNPCYRRESGPQPWLSEVPYGPDLRRICT